MNNKDVLGGNVQSVKNALPSHKNIIRFCRKNSLKIKTVCVLLLAGAMLFKGVMQLPQISQNKKTAAELEEKIAYEATRQQEIEELKTKVDTDEYIEKIASEKLGLVKNNAKIFVDVSDGK